MFAAQMEAAIPVLFVHARRLSAKKKQRESICITQLFFLWMTMIHIIKKTLCFFVKG
jgi:hypothetical protein